jgi:hypothetical protein
MLAAPLLILASSSLQPSHAQGPAQAPPAPSVARERMSWEGFMQDRDFDQFIAIDLRPQPDGGEGTFQVLGRHIPMSEVVWTGDRMTARVSEPADNLTIVATREGNWLSGELREGSSVQRFVLREIPVYPAPRSRNERWSQDLESLTRRYAPLERSLSPGERARFIEAVDALRDDLDRLNDAQVVMRLASAIAIADEPHTRLLLLRNATELRRLPIRVWWFQEGLYVIRTAPEYRHLLGCRIDDFGHVPARQARDLVGRAFAGNPPWRDYLTTYTLTSPEALHGSGVTRSPDSVQIGVSGCRAEGRHDVNPTPLARSGRTVESWWDLSPLRESPHGITAHVLGQNERNLPLYLRNPAAYYSFEYLPQSRIVYFQFTRSDNAQSETVAAFGERLLREIESRTPRALVVDLRFNTGGNANLSRDLFRRLNERTAHIPRYIISGRTTFSAGISAMAQLLSGGPATIVGEPAGDDLDHWSEGGYVRLPNSGLEVDFQTVLHSYSRAPCPRDISCVDMSIDSIEPQFPASLSWRDYMARRDPAMDAVLAHLARPPR